MESGHRHAEAGAGGRAQPQGKRYYFDCRECHYTDDFVTVRVENSGNLAWLLLCGPIGWIVLLLILFRPPKIQCSRCGYVFRQPSPPATPVETLVFWLVVGIVLPILLVFTLNYLPELSEGIPRSGYVDALELWIASNPRQAALWVICFFAVEVLICAIAAVNARSKLKQAVSEEFLMKPRKYTDAPALVPAANAGGDSSPT